MAEAPTTWTAEPFIPEDRSLARLEAASKTCRGCPLYASATQTVFGEGPRSARLILVGEQPGDKEDLAGKPFVGPAGRVLDDALVEAGIDRAQTYLTNVVKHFKWTRAKTGNRRLHAKPTRPEIIACLPWLLAELEALQPDLLVCLGATAAQALLGSSFRVTKSRGVLLPWPGQPFKILATIHPSAVLRTRTKEERHEAFASLVADLKVAAA